MGGAQEVPGEARAREQEFRWRPVPRAGTFTMASAELDYTIEIPDQLCRSQGMERGSVQPWEGDLTSLWFANAAVAPPLSAPPPQGSRRSHTTSGPESPAPL